MSFAASGQGAALWQRPLTLGTALLAALRWYLLATSLALAKAKTLGEGGVQGGVPFPPQGGGMMIPFPMGMMAGGGMPVGMPGRPGVNFGGMPVIVVRGHFGHDPWEDLHQNVQRVVEKNAVPALPGPGGSGQPGRQLAMGGPMGMVGGPIPMAMQLGALFDMFGDDHAGQHGRAEGSFHVEDDHMSMVRITATLPGYNLGAAGEAHKAADSPLTVQVVGHRSLVVKGMQQKGPLLRSWQRSFALPKSADLDHINITFSKSSGNLTVEVPRGNATEDEQEEEKDAMSDPNLPPALKAMMQGMPAVVNRMSEGQEAKKPSGFLLPPPQLPDILGEALGMVSQMHPRFQPPEGGDRPVPEDAEVTMVGCFGEDQLEKVDLKYYGEGNGASFNAMFWHAQADQVPFFAMARHREPLGHAFTAHGFVHEDEKPKWGIYDGCGSRCEDDDSRWCGCSNENERGFGNADCAGGEKRFAVYKVVSQGANASAMAPPASTSEAPGTEASTAAKQPTGAEDAIEEPTVASAPSQGRPYWQLANDANNGGEPVIELMIPKGQRAEPRGREVRLYDAASEPGGGSDGADGPVFVGKMKLPVEVDQEDCTKEPIRTLGDGTQVLMCKLAQNSVRPIPIKIVDEL